MAENESNGTEKTALEKIHEEWVAKGSKRPSDKDIAQLKKAIAEAEKEVTEYEQAVAEARARRDKVHAKALAALGTKTKLDVPGVGILTPSGRGDRAFYKKQGAIDTV